MPQEHVATLFHAALAAARDWHAACPAQQRFTPWPSDMVYAPRPGHRVSAVAHMAQSPGAASGASRALRDALLAVAPFAEWRHTYTEAEVGRDFLERFGWFELAGPDGHFITHQARVTVAYWGPDLFYPRHHHNAEELYTIVAGRAVFAADGADDITLAPGQTRLHASNQPHAMTTTDRPVLTLVLWRGAALADPPRLSA